MSDYTEYFRDLNQKALSKIYALVLKEECKIDECRWFRTMDTRVCKLKFDRHPGTITFYHAR